MPCENVMSIPVNVKRKGYVTSMLSTSLQDDDLEAEAVDAANNARSGASGSSQQAGQAGGEAKRGGVLASFMRSISMNVVGKSQLSAADLEPALADMKRRLMERNVAEEIAANICSSVGK